MEGWNACVGVRPRGRCCAMVERGEGGAATSARDGRGGRHRVRRGAVGAALWRVRLPAALGVLLGVLAGDQLLGGAIPRHHASADIVAPRAPERLGAGDAADQGDTAAARSRELAVLTSAAVLGPVAGRLRAGEPGRAGGADTPAARAEAVARLSARVAGLWHGGGEGPDRLRIIAEARTPERATRLARLVADSYVDHWHSRRREAERWLGARAARLADAAAAAAGRVEALRARLPGDGGEGLSMRRAQLAQLRERAAALGAEIAALQAPVAEVRAARDALLFSRVAELLGDPGLARLAGRVVTGEAGAGGALPETAIARFDAALERRLAARDSERARLAGERRVLLGMITDWEDRAARERRLAAELAEAEAEAERLATTHRAVADQLDARAADARAVAPRISMVSAARPAAPGQDAPARGLVALAGLAGGVLSGLGALALTGGMRPPRPGALEKRTGLKVLGTIPGMPRTPGDARAVLASLGSGAPFAEGLASVRTALMLRSGATLPKIVAVTDGGEDPAARTAACLGLARLGRMRGRRVAVVECDEHDSRLREAFAIPGTAGLASLLGGHAAYHEVLHIDRQTGLHLVPGGPHAPGAGAGALAPARLGECMQLLRRTYDQVFVDLPGPADSDRLEAILGPHDALLCLRAADAPSDRRETAALARLARLDLGASGIALHRPAPAATAAPETAAAGPPPESPGPTDGAEDADDREEPARTGTEPPQNVLYMFRKVQEGR